MKRPDRRFGMIGFFASIRSFLSLYPLPVLRMRGPPFLHPFGIPGSAPIIVVLRMFPPAFQARRLPGFFARRFSTVELVTAVPIIRSKQ